MGDTANRPEGFRTEEELSPSVSDGSTPEGPPGPDPAMLNPGHLTNGAAVAPPSGWPGSSGIGPGDSVNRGRVGRVQDRREPP